MNLLFVADPLETFKTYKDSTYAMMREAQRRGHTLAACEPRHIRWQSGGQVSALVRRIRLTGHEEQWFHESPQAPAQRLTALRDFDAVLMRKDPPFDSEYFYATHLLEQAEREGARVLNKPRALRDHPEKLALLEFPQYTTPTLVTREAQAVRDFHAEYRDIILKPLDGMGGTSVFRLHRQDHNIGVVIETLTHYGRRTVMAQRYIPEIAKGDKRVLIIDGEPVPYALARIPKKGETRGNLAAGGTGVAQPLSARDREIAATIGPALKAQGLMLVGLDVIGDYLTEVNVTSPTCMREIADQTGFSAAAMMIDALEKAARDKG